jgi:cell division septum initiation protein DivIVA
MRSELSVFKMEAALDALRDENERLEKQNAELRARIAELESALQAFVEAWEKSHQLEKTDVALRMARKALEKSE